MTETHGTRQLMGCRERTRYSITRLTRVTQFLTPSTIPSFA